MNSVGVDISHYYFGKLAAAFEELRESIEKRAVELLDQYLEHGFRLDSLVMQPSAAYSYILTDRLDRDNSIGATLGAGLGEPFAYMLKKLMKKQK